MPIAELRPARPRSLGARFRDDDAALVSRTQAGDERAFAAIFKRHHAPLLSYCRHMLGNREEGEDALQQAFIKAHQALLGGTTPRELRPWLYAIVRNCCLSAIAARRATAPLQDHMPALAGLSDEVRQREDLRELLAAIGRLPEDQRSALLLAELDDLSHQAIATVVGCPVSKVKALVYQARSALIADRDARGTPCQDIREQLSTARGGELRRGSLRRHLSLCAGCRDFQLAVSAQRESLAAVLPVLPSAGLAAAILGHGTAHVVGAASIGGAGAGAAPASGGAGTSIGVTTTGATAAGGSGVAATGTAVASTAAGAVAGGGTSVGALVGGGLTAKLAVGGAVAALAAAGTVAVRQRPAKAISSRVAHARLASFAAHRSKVAAIAVANGGPSGAQASGSSTGLIGATGLAGSASPGHLTGLTSSNGPEPPLMLTGTSPPSLALTGIPGQTVVKAGQSGGGKGGLAKTQKTRAKPRRLALRRRARRLRKARRHLHLRKALRKAYRHRRHPAAPKPPKPPAPAVSPVRIRHRKARPTPAPLGAPAGGATGSEGKGAKGLHHPLAARTYAGSTGAKSASPETSTTSTGKGKGKAISGTGTEKAGSTPGTAKSGSGTGTGKAGATSGATKSGSGTGGEKPSSHAGSKETGSGANMGKSGSEAGAGTGSTSKTGHATEASDSAPHTGETKGAGSTSGKGSTSHPKKYLAEEGQLPNF